MKQIENLIDEVITMTGLLLHLEAGGVDLPIEESLLDKYKQLLINWRKYFRATGHYHRQRLQSVFITRQRNY